MAESILTLPIASNSSSSSQTGGSGATFYSGIAVALFPVEYTGTIPMWGDVTIATLQLPQEAANAAFILFYINITNAGSPLNNFVLQGQTSTLISGSGISLSLKFTSTTVTVSGHNSNTSDFSANWKYTSAVIIPLS